MKDLTRIADLSARDLTHLLDLADRFSVAPDAEAGRLEHQTVFLYFAKPSTRTRVSFTAAVAHLGGTPLTVGANELQLGRGETIEDTARVVSSFCSAIVVRTFLDDDVLRLADAASVPVINALTDGHHPCQALADLLTIRQHWGSLEGRKVAYVGDGNNVAHSLVEAAALAAMDVAVATPPGYGPDPRIIAGARAVAERHGGHVLVTNDPYEAVAGADAVYTDVWLSMGDPDQERQARIEALTPYRVDERLMAAAGPEAMFLHCLPAHRGEEVAAEVIDGTRSLVFAQAANRLPTAQAVLAALLDGHLHGAIDVEAGALAR